MTLKLKLIPQDFIDYVKLAERIKQETRQFLKGDTITFEELLFGKTATIAELLEQ